MGKDNGMAKEVRTDLLAVLEETNSLLAETVKIVKEDRKLARETYDFIKDKGNDDDYISEGGELERELNTSLKLILASSDKLTKLLDTVAKIGIAKIRSDTLREINKPQEHLALDLFDSEAKKDFLQQKKNADLIKQEKFLEQG